MVAWNESRGLRTSQRVVPSLVTLLSDGKTFSVIELLLLSRFDHWRVLLSAFQAFASVNCGGSILFEIRVPRAVGKSLYEYALA